ncbi:MAG TPA: thaumatin family protein [Pseudonocardiaceae bacterium]
MRRILPIVIAVVLLGGGFAIWATSGSGSRPIANLDAPVTTTMSGAPILDPVVSLPPTTTTVPPTTTTTVRPTTTKATPKPVAHPKVVSAPAGSRTFTFVNDVHQTIWLAGWQQTANPALTTSGWVLPAGGQVTVVVPDKWNGRFWGRTGCTFNSAGKGHCATGDCGGVFQCKGYGGIPATLAEYNLNSFDNLDFYDVSMVDGSNLPMYINITKGGTKDKISSTGCIAAGCTKPVACPAELVVAGGAGCESACAKLGGDQLCCRGQWAARSACDPTKWQPEDYAAVFKKAEPCACSYVDDDATSTFTCTGECDYRITFGTTP